MAQAVGLVGWQKAKVAAQTGGIGVGGSGQNSGAQCGEIGIAGRNNMRIDARKIAGQRQTPRSNEPIIAGGKLRRARGAIAGERARCGEIPVEDHVGAGSGKRAVSRNQQAGRGQAEQAAASF